MQTYTDEYLHYWADVWVDHELHRYVTLEQFLPHARLTLIRIEDGELRPLLAEQRALAETIYDEERVIERAARGVVTVEDAEHLERIVACARGIVDLPRSNGRAIEPMRHHRWPRNNASLFRPRGEV